MVGPNGAPIFCMGSNATVAHAQLVAITLQTRRKDFAQGAIGLKLPLGASPRYRVRRGFITGEGVLPNMRAKHDRGMHKKLNKYLYTVKTLGMLLRKNIYYYSLKYF